MPAVTITLTDTPTGGVSIKHDFEPRAGAPCSPAQAAALEVISRTRKDYGLPPVLPGAVDRMLKVPGMPVLDGECHR